MSGNVAQEFAEGGQRWPAPGSFGQVLDASASSWRGTGGVGDPDLTAFSGSNDVDVLDRTGGFRDRDSIFPQAFEVKFDGFADFALGFLERGTCCDATGQVRSPACLRILFQVPGARSSLDSPGTVIGDTAAEWTRFVHV